MGLQVMFLVIMAIMQQVLLQKDVGTLEDIVLILLESNVAYINFKNKFLIYKGCTSDGSKVNCNSNAPTAPSGSVVAGCPDRHDWYYGDETCWGGASRNYNTCPSGTSLKPMSLGDDGYSVTIYHFLCIKN